jgi:hypothetical protein
MLTNRKSWLGAFCLLGLLSCSRDPTVLVTVDGIPPTAQSLQVIATHAGFAQAKDIDPYNLQAGKAAAQTMLLRLPAGFSGDIGVSVAAYSMPGAQGCLLATGSNKNAMFSGPDENLRVGLDAVTDTACTGKRPILLSATPGLGKTTGNESVTLTGWGFKPDSTVTMGSKSAMMTFNSAASVTVTTPARAGFGLTPIRVANKDGTFDQRKDLFRFYTDTLTVTPLPFQNSSKFLETSSFVAGVYDPTTTIDLALTLPGTPGSVRIEYTIAGMVISQKQKTVTVGNNPGPIISGDFDKDGDLDLMVANIDDGTAQLLKNDGLGGFTAAAAFGIGGVGSNPVSIAGADLNGDGAPDLAVINKLVGQAGRLRVFLNKNSGDGAMQEIPGSPFKIGNEPVSVAIGDITGDGNPDIAVACQLDEPLGSGMYRTYAVLSTGPGVFIDTSGTNLSLPICKQPTSVQIIDTDNNGKGDLVVSYTGEDKLRIILNMGFPNIAQYDIPTDPMPRNMILSDLNGDGLLDIAVPSQGGNKIDFLLNSPSSGFMGSKLTSQAVTCPQPYVVTSFDVDGDGKNDIGVAGLGTAGTGCLSVLFNQSI